MTPEILQSALTHALALVVAAHRGAADSAFASDPRPSRPTTWSARVNGDGARWTSNIALQHAGELGMSGTQLARTLLRHLGDLPGISRGEVSGPGFVGFDFRPAQLIAAALTLIPQGTRTPADHRDGSAPEQCVPEPSAPTDATTSMPIRDIQLAHALGRRIDRNARTAGLTAAALSRPVDLGPAAVPLLVLLAEHRGVVARSDRADPAGLARHLGALARELTAFVSTAETIPPIHRPDTDTHRTGRTVVSAATHALHHGLDQLGAPAPERM